MLSSGDNNAGSKLTFLNDGDSLPLAFIWARLIGRRPIGPERGRCLREDGLGERACGCEWEPMQ